METNNQEAIDAMEAMADTLYDMDDLLAAMRSEFKAVRDGNKAVRDGNKAAAARVRKLSLELEPLLKRFRKESVEAAKANTKKQNN